MIVKLREPLFAALMLSLLRGETATCSGHVTAGPGLHKYTRDNTLQTAAPISYYVCVSQYYHMRHVHPISVLVRRFVIERYLYR